MIINYLSLQERQQSTTNESRSVVTDTQMMRRVTTGRNIGQPDESTKSIIIKTVSGQKICICQLVLHC